MSGYDELISYQRPWRPVTIADANRYSVSWRRRTAALDLLNEMIYEHQCEAASCARSKRISGGDLRSKPQKAPVHTQFPAFPAARACTGLSAVAEYQAQVGRNRLWIVNMARTLQAEAQTVDPTALQLTIQFVDEAIQNRLCIDHLFRIKGMLAVDSYRLFAMAMLDLRFDRLRDVIQAAVLLGDFLFALLKRGSLANRLHPLTRRIFEAVAPACDAYERRVETGTPAELPQDGERLAVALIKALIPFLPLARPTEPAGITAAPSPPVRRTAPDLRRLARVPKVTPITPMDPELAASRLRGLDEVLPPAIEEPPTGRLGLCASDLAEDKIAHPTAATQATPLHQLLSEVNLTLQQATQRAPWHDPRVDEIAAGIRRNLFRPGIMEDQLKTRPCRVRAFGSDREEVVHEEVLGRSHNPDAISRIRKGAAPIEKMLRRSKWFGRKEVRDLERYQERGGLDPRRLRCVGTSKLLHRRWLARSTIDYRGTPLVVLAKDGSSSNTIETTFAGQILAAAFLGVERIARIRVVAADYSSDGTGRLVRWLRHPKKSPRLGPEGAAATIGNLPPKGQGGNEDVMSVSYIMREALDVAVGQTVHVVNITDGKFNSPLPQVKAMIRTLREDHDVTYSLIVLGDTKVEIPEANYTVRVPGSELRNPQQIAERIGRHVNRLVRHMRARRGSASHG